MIVSHKFGAIFIHCPKTAGTSIKSLMVREDPQAVVLSPHLRVSDGKKLVHKFHTFFRFSSVRHPCDVLVSHYLNIIRLERHHLHFQVAKQGMTFSQWLRFHTEECGNFVCAWFIDGPVDYIVRFEHLEQDLNKLMDRFGIENRTIPNLNVATNRQGPWQEYFKDGDIDYVKTNYAEDFTRFGYTL